jgi:succinate dehydrogenase/fumarate reductase flavoprotein subunit
MCRWSAQASPDFLGIVRREEGLGAGLAHVRALMQELEARRPAAGWRALRAWCELRSLCDTALLSLTAATYRRESRGAHYRADLPGPGDVRWLGTVRLVRGADGGPEVAFVAAEREAREPGRSDPTCARQGPRQRQKAVDMPAVPP